MKFLEKMYSRAKNKSQSEVDEEIKVELNRRFAACRNKIKWKTHETDIIKENYEKLSDKQIHEQLLPHRRKNAITAKRQQLGCHKKMQKHQIWTPEEIKLLNEHWKDYDQKELKEKFFPNKTVQQVRNRKMYSGLKGRRIWIEEERGILLEHGANYTHKEMHEKFLPNKTPRQIIDMRKYFGIKRRQ